MKIVYIVQSEYADYECSATYPIRAFLNKEKAKEFMDDLELRNMVLRDKINELREERDKERRRIDTMNIDRKSQEWIMKITELSKIYREKEEQLIKESKLGDNFISNMELEAIGIEELELDESE